MRVLLAGESWVTVEWNIIGIDQLLIGGSRVLEPTEFLGALRGEGIEVTHYPAERVHAEFPETAAALAEWDAVILSDIGSNTLLLHPAMYRTEAATPNRIRAIADYVNEGGGLLMCGGYMSFAGAENKARYGATPLAECLPVGMLNHDDREERPEGVWPRIELPQHQVLDGIPAEPWPVFLGYNRTETLPAATMVATIEGNPFLALGEYGAGRTAAFTSDCMPHWGSREFVNWPHYGRLFGNILRWLADGA